MRGTAARSLSVVPAERLVALVTRVSTDHQTRSAEGSLTTQLQRLRQHIDYKNSVGSERWTEAAVYELRAISGSDSVRSDQFKHLYADIEAGRVNTVMFASLSRLCRSVKDFLQFVEFLQAHNANFVSLKEDYDTTSAHGRLIMTIVMALAEFEREQTSERTRDAFQARSQRGLWNGGRLLGFDLDAARKGYLIPNADEVATVNAVFQLYLECGSIAETTQLVNIRGFRTKAYSSRRGLDHAGGLFGTTTVQHMLKNPAYAGKKLIDARGERRLVAAVWPAIIDDDVFRRAQRLLALNGRTNHSQARTPRHVHVLAGGLLRCGRCGAAMQGRSGTGKHGKAYFYYVCAGPDCHLRVVAGEVEGAVIDRMRRLVAEPETVAALTEKANRLLQRQKPDIEKRLRALARTMRSLNGEADRVARGLGQATPPAARLLNQRLEEIAVRREQTASAISEAELELASIGRAEVTAAAVRDGLLNFERVFPHLRPHEQRDLVRLLVRKAELGDRELVLEIYGKASACFAGQEKANPGLGFAEASDWLPGRDSNPEPIG